MSWFKSPCEVLVAGAGPVGQFCALELARRGVSVRVLEEQWRTTSRSYALGLHPRTLELLHRHGQGIIENIERLRQELKEANNELWRAVNHHSHTESGKVVKE